MLVACIGAGWSASGLAAASLTPSKLAALEVPTLTLIASPQLPIAGQSMMLYANVAQQGLDGTVTFTENGAALAGCASLGLTPLVGSTNVGVASCKIDLVTAGDHTYAAGFQQAAGMPLEQVTVTVNAAAVGPLDYSDMWWGGKSENGWGVSVNQHGMTQIVVLFVYDAVGGPVWYLMPGGRWNAAMNVYTGALYQPTSAPYQIYDASKFKLNDAVGSVTIAYTSEAAATITYSIYGISGTKQLIRQPFPADSGTGMAVNDLWWGGSKEAGWGLSIDQHGRTLFPVLFTFNSSYVTNYPFSTGNTTFYTVLGGAWSGNTYKGDIYLSSSSPWLGMNYNALAFRTFKVGTMSLTFINDDTATMTTNINGVIHTDTLARQPY